VEDSGVYTLDGSFLAHEPVVWEDGDLDGDDDDMIGSLTDATDVLKDSKSNTVSHEMFLHIQISSRRVCVLIDTGATRSFIDTKLQQQLQLPVQSRETLQLLTVAGFTTSKGTCNLTFNIGDNTFSHIFIIMPLPRMAAILGIDFLTRHSAAISTVPPRLLIHNRSYVLQGRRAHTTCVYLAHALLIPPHLSTVIYLCNSDQIETSTGLFIPAENYRHFFSDAIVDCSGEFIRILATSFENSDCFLYTGTALGSVTEIPEELNCINCSFSNVTTQSDEIKMSPDHIPYCFSNHLFPRTVSLFASTQPLKASDSTNTLAPELEELFKRASLTSPSSKNQLRALLLKYVRIFSPPSPLGCISNVKHHILLKESDRIHAEPPRRLGPEGRNKVREKLQEMKDLGAIRRSSSPFASGVVLVPKKDGSVRFCIDYRQLNLNTVPCAYPLPRIDDLLNAVREARIFSKFDLRAGYWQLEMHEDDVHKTAFTTHEGLFECLRMPFGLCNAPATFQSAMNRILASVL